MIEQYGFTPELEIAQTEIQAFGDSIKQLVSDKKPLKHAEYPVMIDGEKKLAYLSSTGRGESNSIMLIDLEPVDSNKTTFIYEELFSVRLHNGKFAIDYVQGACRKNRFGRWADTTESSTDIFETVANFQNLINGKILRRLMEGEPIDEFRKMQSVVDQIKQNELAKQKRGFGRITRLWKRG